MNGFAGRMVAAGVSALVLGSAGCGGSSAPAPSPPTSGVTQTAAAPQRVQIGVDAKPLTVPDEAVPAAGGGLAAPELPGSVAAAVELDAESQTAWTQLLKPDLSPEAWEAARQTLLDRGVAAEPLLLQELASSDAYHRETAATLLAQLGVPSETARKGLVRCLDDDSPFVRANAAAALAPVPELGEKVVPVLTKLLKESDPQLRKMAAMNLSSFGAEAAPEVATLAAALDDKDEEVILPVVQLLGRIGQKAEPAMGRLQQIAFEQEGEIRRAAETAIEQIRSTSDKSE